MRILACRTALPSVLVLMVIAARMKRYVIWKAIATAFLPTALCPPYAVLPYAVVIAIAVTAKRATLFLVRAPASVLEQQLKPTPDFAH